MNLAIFSDTPEFEVAKGIKLMEGFNDGTNVFHFRNLVTGTITSTKDARIAGCCEYLQGVLITQGYLDQTDKTVAAATDYILRHAPLLWNMLFD